MPLEDAKFLRRPPFRYRRPIYDRRFCAQKRVWSLDEDNMTDTALNVSLVDESDSKHDEDEKYITKSTSDEKYISSTEWEIEVSCSLQGQREANIQDRKTPKRNTEHQSLVNSVDGDDVGFHRGSSVDKSLDSPGGSKRDSAISTPLGAKPTRDDMKNESGLVDVVRSQNISYPSMAAEKSYGGPSRGTMTDIEARPRHPVISHPPHRGTGPLPKFMGEVMDIQPLTDTIRIVHPILSYARLLRAVQDIHLKITASSKLHGLGLFLDSSYWRDIARHHANIARHHARRVLASLLTPPLQGFFIPFHTFIQRVFRIWLDEDNIQCFSIYHEWPDNDLQRLSLYRWPYNMRIPVVVIWGVCWMFTAIYEEYFNLEGLFPDDFDWNMPEISTPKPEQLQNPSPEAFVTDASQTESAFIWADSFKGTSLSQGLTSLPQGKELSPLYIGRNDTPGQCENACINAVNIRHNLNPTFVFTESSLVAVHTAAPLSSVSPTLLDGGDSDLARHAGSTSAKIISSGFKTPEGSPSHESSVSGPNTRLPSPSQLSTVAQNTEKQTLPTPPPLKKRKPKYECPQAACREAFQARRDLDTHISSHIGPSYACEICGTKTARKDNLKKHLEKYHPEDFDKTDIGKAILLKRRIKALKQHSRTVKSDDKSGLNPNELQVVTPPSTKNTTEVEERLLATLKRIERLEDEKDKEISRLQNRLERCMAENERLRKRNRSLMKMMMDSEPGFEDLDEDEDDVLLISARQKRAKRTS